VDGETLGGIPEPFSSLQLFLVISHCVRGGETARHQAEFAGSRELLTRDAAIVVRVGLLEVGDDSYCVRGREGVVASVKPRGLCPSSSLPSCYAIDFA
jgi:hypothetical protein